MDELDLRGFDATARAAVLRAAPTLAGLDDAVLTALAEAMVIRRYAYKTVLVRLGQPARGRALRVIILGTCLVQAPGSRDSRRVVGPGFVLGEEGLVDWAAAHGLTAPAPDGPLDYHAYATEDCWVLELTADRFAAVFAAGDHAPALARLRAAVWRTARMPELLDALQQTPELARASIDDIHALVEGGSLQHFTDEAAEASDDSVLVVLEGGVRLIGDQDEELAVLGPGSVIGQSTFLRAESPAYRLRQPAATDQPTVVLALPTGHYARLLCARPELLRAVLRVIPEQLAWPTYRTEVALILASEALQRTLPLGPMADTLAQAIRSNLHDITWVVELVWADPVTPVAQPPRVRIAVPRGTPVQVEEFVRASLLALLRSSAHQVDVLVVDPSALDPDVAIKRALARAVTRLPAPTRLSYLFSTRREWSRVIDILGDRLTASTLPTVVLGAEAPAPGLGAALDDIGAGLVRGRRSALAHGLKAIPTFILGQLRRLTSVDPRALREAATGDLMKQLIGRGPAQVWPKQAVRLRFTDAGRAALAARSGRPMLADEGDRESFRRWARAITGRRVGIALGGAGALSYVCVPLIRALHANGVPIDVVSGTSFGSIVGAYYTALGEAGLDLIVRHWYWAQITVAWGFITARPLQQWINFDLGFVDISQLAVPFVPVAANAYNGREWDLRVGLIGHACSASGSLPPLAPTYDGDTRLIDGALVAGVPDRVLVESGAAMVVGANAVAPVGVEPALPAIPIPILGDLIRELNPITRMTDAIRGYNMLFRQSGQSQERFAAVTYLADTRFGNGATFFLRNAILYQAENSKTLREAVKLARERWSELLARPPRRPSPSASSTRTTEASHSPPV